MFWVGEIAQPLNAMLTDKNGNIFHSTRELILAFFLKEPYLFCILCTWCYVCMYICTQTEGIGSHGMTVIDGMSLYVGAGN